MSSRLRECLASAGWDMGASVDRVNAIAGPDAQASRQAGAFFLSRQATPRSNCKKVKSTGARLMEARDAAGYRGVARTDAAAPLARSGFGGPLEGSRRGAPVAVERAWI